jgi:cytochrome c oxidase cbb3-type subunit 3
MNETNPPQENRSDQDDQLRDHDYDGIQEYDNRLPNWWLFILYGSIVFSLCYWLVFHTFHIGKLPRESYEREMVAAAEAQLARAAEGGTTNESLQLMSTIPDRIAAGKQIFVQYCSVCHLEDGSGSVGPNLTDDYWIHGAAPMDILGIVTNGVTAKGMAAWGNQLGPKRVENVVSYVLTLKGKNLPGKAPEGELITTETDVEGTN